MYIVSQSVCVCFDISICMYKYKTQDIYEEKFLMTICTYWTHIFYGIKSKLDNHEKCLAQYIREY